MTNSKQISNNAYRKVAPPMPDIFPRFFPFLLNCQAFPFISSSSCQNSSGYICTWCV